MSRGHGRSALSFQCSVASVQAAAAPISQFDAARRNSVMGTVHYDDDCGSRRNAASLCRLLAECNEVRETASRQARTCPGRLRSCIKRSHRLLRECFRSPATKFVNLAAHARVRLRDALHLSAVRLRISVQERSIRSWRASLDDRCSRGAFKSKLGPVRTAATVLPLMTAGVYRANLPFLTWSPFHDDSKIRFLTPRIS